MTFHHTNESQEIAGELVGAGQVRAGSASSQQQCQGPPVPRDNEHHAGARAQPASLAPIAAAWAEGAA